ncbi:PTS IIA-like nitrogen regulatory protein PtsN [Avibacterium paragallinarum]|uniref:Nitrogen regulatory IIA protein n=1 Tax=Avibacterium paragallinarum TaxID=728 RepID=A0A0F5EQ12_AVIPA|nr:PTS IIA-like nitrogen regulatory protein PtsN [Avibacterium paragallinarum]AZI13845.1 PTS IIA-like nitrogen-regulatory protein PtsN [Avibacterium paragallinarum]KAA6209918.1 PTS IIA-like nitrogen regulatory protein PtsN [Avibacterium paragallinarum]KKB02185.1 PTS sugar transporter subunit IIA [Avibacterium paragallinarum]POY47285.1 PTS IIA-like nitrogen-regulatory protein PtsN [Avibacterium paragallinarum]QIR11836.1 PTS IIA-like nitrogen regulatory protein PtsN [Avibacterium paragallinarum]
MVKFTTLLTPENIRQGVVCSSKKRAFEMISHLVSSQIDDKDPEHSGFECLFSREKLGNSGLGNGVAMPKGRLPKGDKPIAVFLQLNTPIDYESQDHRDVDLIFALLVPSTICGEFAQTILPQLAEKLLDKSLCKQLRAAQSAEEIWQIFEYADRLNNEETENNMSNGDIN